MEANNYFIDSILSDIQRENAWREIIEAYASQHKLLRGREIEDILESIQEYVYMRKFDKCEYNTKRLLEAMDYIARIATFLAGIIVHNRHKDMDSDFITKSVVNCISNLNRLSKSTSAEIPPI